jgi:hypothetical protein
MARGISILDFGLGILDLERRAHRDWVRLDECIDWPGRGLAGNLGSFVQIEFVGRVQRPMVVAL